MSYKYKLIISYKTKYVSTFYNALINTMFCKNKNKSMMLQYNNE